MASLMEEMLDVLQKENESIINYWYVRREDRCTHQIRYKENFGDFRERTGNRRYN